MTSQPRTIASTGAQRRPSLRPLSIALMLIGGRAFALPEGPTATFGEATVTNTSRTTMRIDQTSATAGIDWRSFSIGANERLTVMQPSAAAVLLNRVTGWDPSSILGQMVANGRIYLVNPNGIVFGAGARVNVGGLVATTMNVSNPNVISGGPLALSGTTGSVVNEGSISAPAGTVVLAAPQVTNRGAIEAARVGLAAATEVLVDVEGDGLLFFNVKASDVDTRLEQLGGVTADNLAELRAAARAGFAGTVLNTEGLVRARGLSSQGGRVVIGGGDTGIVAVAGTVDASSATGQGGSVTVTGDKVLLDSTAHVHASGATGGGSVRIGGDLHGAGNEVRNASMVTVRAGATIAADATGTGDGGRVIVWSDEATRYAGAITARGAGSGSGGFAEVSGKTMLAFGGTADLSGAPGRNGTLLLDPRNISIVDGTGTDLASPTLVFGTGGGTDSLINADSVSRQLDAGGSGTDVRLQATNNITVGAEVTGTKAGSLTLEAGNSIAVNADLNVAGGIALNANAGASATNAGGVTLAAGVALNAGSAAVTISNTGSSGTNSLNGNSITSGNLTLGAATLSGTVTLNVGGNGIASGLSGAGALVKRGDGTLTLSGDNSGLSGGITVNDAGTLVIGHANALGSGVTRLNGNSTLAFTAAADPRNIVAGAGNTIEARGDTLALASDFGAGHLLVSGGTLELNGRSSTTEATVTDIRVTAGTLSLGADDVLHGAAVIVSGGAAGSPTLNLNDHNTTAASFTLGGTGPDATGSLNGGGQLTAASHVLFDGAINADLVGAVSKAATGATSNGTVTINGRIAGDLTINGGAVNIDSGGAINDNSSVTVHDGGTLIIANSIRLDSLTLGDAEGSGLATLTGSGAATTIQASRFLLNAGEVGANLLSAGGAGAITKASNRTVVLTRGTTMTDTLVSVQAGELDVNGRLITTHVNIAGGTLKLGATGSLLAPEGSLAAPSMTVAGNTDANARFDTGGGTVTLGGLVLGSGDGLAGSISGGGSIDASTATLHRGTVDTVLSGVTVTKTADGSTTGGTVTLDSNGRIVAASLVIEEGTLALGGSDRIGDITSVTLASTNYATAAGRAVLALGTNDETIGNLVLTSGDVTGSGRLSITLPGTGGQFNVVQGSISANLDGGATLTKTGNGTVTLGGDNSGLTGPIVVTEGVLQIGQAGGTNGGTGTGAITLDGAAELRFARDGDYEVRNNLSGAGRILRQGDGVLTLSGNGAGRTGATDITGGTLAVASDTALGMGRATLSDGTTVAFTAGYDTTGISGGIGGTGTIEQRGGGTTLILGADTAGLGSPDLRVTGGTMLLAGSRDATNVTVNGGTLRLGTDEALTANTALTIARTGIAPAALDLAGHHTTLKSVTLGTADGAGAIGSSVAGSGARLTLGSGISNRYDLVNGAIDNAQLLGGSTHKTGDTLVTIGTDARIGSDGTTVSGGELRLAGSGGAGNLGGQILIDGGRLSINGADALTATASVTVAGSAGGNAELALGANTVTLTTFQLGDAGLTGTLSGAGGGKLTATGADSATTPAIRLVGGQIDGVALSTTDSRIVKSGNGTVSTNAGITVASDTPANRLLSIEGGTLELGASGLLDAGAALVVATAAGASTATLDLKGFDAGVASVRLGVAGSDAGTAAAGAGSITGGGTLTATDGFDLRSGTVGSTLGDAAHTEAATKTGFGAVTLASGGTITGDLTVREGSLQANGRLSGKVIVVDGGTLLLNTAAQTSATQVTVSAGTLQLQNDGLLNPLAALTVARGGDAGATLDFNGHTASVADFTLGTVGGDTSTGTVTGAGGLDSAGGYALRSGTVATRLGSHASGDVFGMTGGGTVAVTATGRLDGEVRVAEGGRLEATGTVGAAGRDILVTDGTLAVRSNAALDGDAALTVAATGTGAATLDLGNGAVARAASLVLGGADGGQAGAVTGDGRLDAASYTLNAGSIAGNLGAGSAMKTSDGTVTLTGVIGAGAAVGTSSLDIRQGSVVLGAPGTFGSNTHVAVTGGTLDLAGHAATAASVALAGGEIASTGADAANGVLTAATYDLRSGTVSGHLGGGSATLSAGGTVTLSGSIGRDAAAGRSTITIGEGSTLALAGEGNHLGDNSSVTLRDGRLALGALSETVGSFALDASSQTGGVLDGSGTLTAASYALRQGTINAGLGLGDAVKSTDGSVLLAGTLGMGAGSGTQSTLDVRGGTLTLSGTLAGEGHIGDLAAVTVSSGTLDLAALSETVGAFTLAGGRLAGSATLTSASGYNLLSGTLDANLGAGTATKNDDPRDPEHGTVTLTADRRIAGPVVVNAGTLLANGNIDGTQITITGGRLALGADERLDNGATVVVAGDGATLDLGSRTETVATLRLGSADGARAGTITGSGRLVATDGYALAAGTVDANLGAGSAAKDSTGALSLTAGHSIAADLTVAAGTMTATGKLEGANLLVTGGRLTVGDDVAATSITVNGGTLALGHADVLNHSATLDVSQTGTVTANVELDGFTATVNEVIVGGADGTGAGRIGDSPGTGKLVAANYTLRSGTVDGALGAGTLTKTTDGTISLGARIDATSISVRGGTLELTGNELFAPASETTVDGGTLALAGHTVTTGTLHLLSGSVSADNAAGTLGITTRASAALSGSAFDLRAGSVSAALAGEGALTKTTEGTVVLSGSNRFTGTTTVTEGVLRLASTTGTALADTGEVIINGDAAHLDLASGNAARSETVGGVTLLNGSITGGDQTLAASHFNVTKGSISARLADAAGKHADLVKTGTDTVTLSGSNSYTGGTTVNAGTLQLASADGTALADTGAVMIDGAGAVLALANTNAGGSETVGQVRLVNGSIVGDGQTLAGVGFTVQQGSISANLTDAAGVHATLDKTGAGSVTLSGVNRYTGTTTVNGGDLRLAGGQAIADESSVRVNASARLVLDTSETVGDLALVGGTLGADQVSTADLLASSSAAGTPLLLTISAGHKATLSGGARIATDLAGAVDNSGGTTVLDGHLRNGRLDITGGSVSLSAADRLGDELAVTASNGGTLDLGAFNESVATLQLTGATLAGTGTLTATTTRIDGATINANLGRGALVQHGGASTLAGTSAADITVEGGRLTATSTGRILDAARVTIKRDATLVLQGNETLGAVKNDGSLMAGQGLTATSLSNNGTATISQTLTTTGATDNTGTLTTGGAISVATLTNSGLLKAGGNITATGVLTGSSDAGRAISSTGGIELADGATVQTLAGDQYYDNGSATQASLTGKNITLDATGHAITVGNPLNTGTASGGSFQNQLTVHARHVSLSSLGNLVIRGEIGGAGSGDAGLVLRTRANGTEAGALTIGKAADSGDNSLLVLVDAGSASSVTSAGAMTITGTLRQQRGNLTLVTGAALAVPGSLAVEGGKLAANVGGDFTVSGNMTTSGDASVDVKSTGTATLAAGSVWTQTSGAATVEANGRIYLLGTLDLKSGALTFVSNEEQTKGNEILAANGQSALVYPGSRGGSNPLRLYYAEDGISDAASTSVITHAGSQLNLHTTKGASISLTGDGNKLGGGLSAIVDSPPPAATEATLVEGMAPLRNNGTEQWLSQVKITTTGTLNVRGSDLGTPEAGAAMQAGIEADLVRLTATSITSPATPVGSGMRASPVVARLPYWDQAGIDPARQLAALELTTLSTTTLTPAAPVSTAELPAPFGSSDQSGVNVRIGQQRSVSLNGMASGGGYVVVNPFPLSRPANQTIFLNGDLTADGNYRLFYPGAGRLDYIPVAYNGVLPSTPQATGALSAIIAIIEAARREQFESTVRTENVAPRLRSGVIAEVGPGRAATEGSGDITRPDSCEPLGGSLSCQ